MLDENKKKGKRKEDRREESMKKRNHLKWKNCANSLAWQHIQQQQQQQ